MLNYDELGDQAAAVIGRCFLSSAHSEHTNLTTEGAFTRRGPPCAPSLADHHCDGNGPARNSFARLFLSIYCPI